MLIESLDQLLILCLVGLLSWAVVSDLLTLTIPNRVTVGIVALYPAWVVAVWPEAQPVASLAIAGAVLAVGFIGFSLSFFGGGDIKLLTATSLWAGPGLIIEMLIFTALAGGVLSLAIYLPALFRQRVAPLFGHVAETDHGSLARTPVPYGVAIAVGGAVVAMNLWVG